MCISGQRNPTPPPPYPPLLSISFSSATLWYQRASHTHESFTQGNRCHLCKEEESLQLMSIGRHRQHAALARCFSLARLPLLWSGCNLSQPTPQQITYRSFLCGN